MRHFLLLVFASMFVTGVQLAAFADDSYVQGCQFYSKGNYNAALSCFQKLAATYPRTAVVHYQLANTYMQLHRRSEAKEEYSRCLTLRPDGTTAAYCQKMIDYLSGGGASQKPLASSSSHESLPANHDSDELAARKDKVMREAQAQANAIRADADKQIREIAENTQQHVFNPATGEMSTGISNTQAEAIKNEAEEKAKAILERARDQVDHMH